MSSSSDKQPERKKFTLNFNVVTLDAGRYECQVCSVKDMSAAAIGEHTQSKLHHRRVANFSKQTRVELNRFCNLITTPFHTDVVRAGELRDPLQKQAIQAEMLCYLVAPVDTNKDEKDDEANTTILQPALKKLKRCEFVEGVTALALAVWKAQCLNNIPVRALDCTGGLVAVQEYLQKWEKSGWKTIKEKHRNTNAMRIIVSAVLPFLSRDNA